MALSDITYGATAGSEDPINFIISVSRGNIGTVSSIETETNSSYGVLQMKTISTATTEYSFTFVN